MNLKKIQFIVQIIQMKEQKQKSAIFHQDEMQTSRRIYVKNSNQIQQVDFRKAHFGKRRKVVKSVDLSNILFKHKVKQLVNTFITKLRTNSIYRQPCEDYSIEKTRGKNKSKFFSCFADWVDKCYENEGLEIGNFGLILWSLISILQITIMVFMFSIMITFPETQHFESFLYFRMFSIGVYFVDVILSMTVKRYGAGKNLQKLGQISSYYIRNEFGIDLASILIFPIDIFFNVQTNIEIFLFFLAVVKQINNLRKFGKFQYLFIDTSWKEHYYGLIKVFLVNFAIAHFLSVILNSIAQFDSHQNWYSKIHIQNQPWHIKYIWGYYWGTNIMLTVGFGDISAANYYQAFALIFIQAFSCITLAYNISYVGALIGSLRDNQKSKKKKLKVFHRMCKQNFINNETESKVANFIEVEHKVKEQFEYQAHDEVLKQLPVSIQRQFRQQANRTLFENLGFLNDFLKKGLVRLAEKIQRRVYHPQQIIYKRGTVPNFSVLQTGNLGLVCRIKSVLDGKQIQRIQVGKGQKPKIITFDFIKNKEISYNVKSNDFSVLFYLSGEELIQCLRASDLSFETYLMLKDRQDEKYGQNHTCSACKQTHTKFECSRLHYVPLSRHIIFKHLYKINNKKQERVQKLKRHKSTKSSLLNNYIININQKKFLQQKFGNDHLQEAEDLCRFYSTQKVIMQAQQDELNLRRSSKIEIELLRSTKNKENWGRRTFSKLQRLFENKQNKPTDYWEIESDIVNNYKFYFKEANAENLCQKYRKAKIGSTFAI